MHLMWTKGKEKDYLLLYWNIINVESFQRWKTDIYFYLGLILVEIGYCIAYIILWEQLIGAEICRNGKINIKIYDEQNSGCFYTW